MKKIVSIVALALCFSGAVFAQNISKSELKSLQTFLNQPASEGGNNAEALKMVGSNYAACPGIKTENGHVTEIDWSGHKLAGTLNLSNFPNH